MARNFTLRLGGNSCSNCSRDRAGKVGVQDATDWAFSAFSRPLRFYSKRHSIRVEGPFFVFVYFLGAAKGKASVVNDSQSIGCESLLKVFGGLDGHNLNK